MGRSNHALLLLVVAVAAATCSSAAAQVVPAEVSEVCKGTPYADLCSATAGKQAGHYPTVDALAVLNMQVDAFAKRTSAARERVTQMSAGATPGAKKALETCDTLYSDVEDNLGAARRAIGFKDATTIRAMMGMAAQDMQNCDEEFRIAGEKNPMDRFDQSLLRISENCRALSNMI
ncbi:hypothetical protein D1007_33665 [Hordeum vulgare]|uniref:Pectinesterase inhibitor domain-containing protein n=1 Tax=Hordeum vulgare subsp. vulgare TaxID=112509 RepID=A0A8I6XL56_HORVV|nr:uncharacterized protein LOC123439747 [Hordeum vulgare subsp. vulgare]KAE8791836.1 hypothetical protein D1007_33665 [Hordeum vulgare]KAI5006426.1 hypothetical protein ZWY2020_033669 [Hordeum vulgare]